MNAPSDYLNVYSFERSVVRSSSEKSYIPGTVVDPNCSLRTPMSPAEHYRVWLLPSPALRAPARIATAAAKLAFALLRHVRTPAARSSSFAPHQNRWCCQNSPSFHASAWLGSSPSFMNLSPSMENAASRKPTVLPVVLTPPLDRAPSCHSGHMSLCPFGTAGAHRRWPTRWQWHAPGCTVGILERADGSSPALRSDVRVVRLGQA